MGELAARGPGAAVGDEALAQGGPAHGGNDAGDRSEILGPALGKDELARQPEGQIEDAKPWAGPGEKGIEAGEIGNALDALQAQARAAGPAGGDHDRLAR